MGLLINYYEDDSGNQYGYFINFDGKLFFFEIDEDENIKFTVREVDEELENDCPQYMVALGMIKMNK